MNGTAVWALRRSASGAPILLLSLPLLGVARLLPTYGFGLWLRLVAASLVLLLPGALVARALWLRGASATVAWGLGALGPALLLVFVVQDRKSTRLNSSHLVISYAVFCLKKKKIGSIVCCCRA